MDRRTFVKGSALAAAGTTLFGKDFWHQVWAAVDPGPGPYGPLIAADANGIQLPAGFTSRVIATTGQIVAPSTRAWHPAPDGGACFAVPGGGWVYVSNSEVSATGGVGAVKFDATGKVVDSYSILSNTSGNCSGGLTPWGTWLSCEEITGGQVYECNPFLPSQGVRRPALGTFVHEGAVVDPRTSIVYMTEDVNEGRLYRFVPTTYGDLSAGQVQAAKVTGTNVTWVNVSADAPAPRDATTTAFNRPEGIWMGVGAVYFSTTADSKVWELTTATQQLQVLYDASTNPALPLHTPDALTVHVQSRDLYVGEDGDNLELCFIGDVGGVRQCAVFARWVGHEGSGLTGPSFTPDGTRLIISSQRGAFGSGGIGVTYEITGPFRGLPPAGASQFAPVTPRRVLDTRDGTGAPAGKPGQGATVDVQVTGDTIPANATAVVLNIVGTEATADGFLTAFPTGEARPLAANQNLVTGQTRGNLVTAKVGTGGKVSIFTQSGTHLVADAFGYYAPPSSGAGRFTPLAPQRLLDTRATGKVAPGGSVDVQVTGAGGVPAAGVSGVVVNITATDATAPGFVTGHAAGTVRPFTANLNVDRAGQTIGNLAILPVGAGGKVTLFSQSGTHLVVDVAGWFGDGSGDYTNTGLYVPLTPVRVLDTRNAPLSKLAAGGSIDVTLAGVGGVPSSGAAGVLMNLTMVDVTAPGFVTAFPAGQTRNEVSSVYADTAGQTIPSLVAAQLGAGGRVTFFSNAGTHVVADLAGWYTS